MAEPGASLMDDIDQVLHELIVGGDKLMKLVVEASVELACV